MPDEKQLSDLRELIEEARRIVKSDDRKKMVLALIIEEACPHLWGRHKIGECWVDEEVHDVFYCEVCGKNLRVPHKDPA